MPRLTQNHLETQEEPIVNLNITLSVGEVQTILAAIAKQPFEQVADLFFKLKQQAEQQLAAQQEQPQVGGTD